MDNLDHQRWQKLEMSLEKLVARADAIAEALKGTSPNDENLGIASNVAQIAEHLYETDSAIRAIDAGPSAAERYQRFNLMWESLKTVEFRLRIVVIQLWILIGLACIFSIRHW